MRKKKKIRKSFQSPGVTLNCTWEPEQQRIGEWEIMAGSMESGGPRAMGGYGSAYQLGFMLVDLIGEFHEQADAFADLDDQDSRSVAHMVMDGLLEIREEWFQWVLLKYDERFLDSLSGPSVEAGAHPASSRVGCKGGV